VVVLVRVDTDTVQASCRERGFGLDSCSTKTRNAAGRDEASFRAAKCCVLLFFLACILLACFVVFGLCFWPLISFHYSIRKVCAFAPRHQSWFFPQHLFVKKNNHFSHLCILFIR